MFSLIVTIIAIALVAALAIATLYYGGSSFLEGSTRTAAATLLNQGAQIAGATMLYSEDQQVVPTRPTDLVAQHYLQDLPLPPKSAYFGDLVPSKTHWEWFSPTTVHVVLRNKINEKTCREINIKANQTSDIPPILRPEWIVQCYGFAEPYTFYFDPPGIPQTEREEIARTLSEALIDVSPDPLDFGSLLVGSQSSPVDITVRNIGGGEQGMLFISDVYVEGDFSADSDCFAKPMWNGDTCTISAWFKPASVGAKTGKITLENNSRDNPYTIALAGNGTLAVSPAITFSPSPVQFPDTPRASSSSPEAVTISNVGSAPFNIGSPTLAGPYTQTNNCPAALEPSDSCQMMVTFSPPVAGSQPGTVTLSGNLVSPATLVLNGSGTSGVPPHPVLSFNPASLTLAPQKVGLVSSVSTIVMTNAGSAPFVRTGITAGAPFAVTHNCPASLAPQTSCNLSVTYTPTTMGAATGTITVTGNLNGPEFVPLSGSGWKDPVLTVAPTRVDFGSYVENSQSPLVPLTVTNTGGNTLTISSLAVSGMFTATSTCEGVNLTANQSCQIQAGFSPTGAGAQTGQITLANNSSVSSVVVPLTGTGTPTPVPALTLSPNPITFAARTIGSTSPISAATLTNVGSANFTLGTVTTSGTSFSSTNNCPAILAPTASCSIAVTFVPMDIGGVTGSVTVTGNVTTPAVLTLAGTGEVAPPVIDPVIEEPPDTPGGTTPDIDVPVCNTSDTPITVDDIAAPEPWVISSTTCGAVTQPGECCAVSMICVCHELGEYTGDLAITTTNYSGCSTQCGINQPARPVTTSSSIDPYLGTNRYSSGYTGTGGYGTPVSRTTSTKTISQTVAGPASPVPASSSFGVAFLDRNTRGSVPFTNRGSSPIAFNGFSVGGSSGGGYGSGGGVAGAGGGGGSWSSGAFVGAGTTCGATVAPGETCEIFYDTPPGVAPGNYEGTVTVDTDQGDYDVPVYGEVLNVNCPYDASAYNAGNVPVGSTVYVTVPFTNHSAVYASISAISINSPYAISSHNCGTGLSAGTSCNIIVSFAPPQARGYGRNLKVTSSYAQGDTYTTLITGTGIAATSPISPATGLALAGAVGQTVTGNFSFINRNPSGSVSLSNVTASAPFSVQSNSCGGTVSAGHSCTITVAQASAVSSSTGTLSLNTSYGAQSYSVPITSTLTGYYYDIDVFQNNLAFGNVTVGYPSDATIVLKNVGIASISGISFDNGGNNEFVSAGSTCGGTLAPNATCTYTIRYTPTATGSDSANLSFGTAQGTSTLAQATGTGIAAVGTLVLTPNAISFPNTSAGATSDTLINVVASNSGTGPVVLSANFALSGSNANQFAIHANSCVSGFTALPNNGSTCQVTLKFSPTVAGAASAIITPSSNASNSPTLTLSGTGVGAALSVNPSSLSFTANIGSSQTNSVTISNSGNQSVIPTVSVSGAGYSISGNNCTGGVVAGGSCTVVVAYAPSGTASVSGLLSISGGYTSPHNITLSGVGTGPLMALDLSTISLANSPIGQTTTQTITLSNPGTATLTVSQITLSSPFIQGGTCFAPGSLAAGGSCSITVSFNPSTATSYSGTLVVVSNGLNASTISTPVTGNGTGAALSTSTAAVNFGNVNVGAQSTLGVTVSNVGSTVVNITSVSVSGLGMSAAHNCATLNVGGSCTVNTTFTPSAHGATAGTLTLNYGSGSTKTVSLSGTGLGAILALSPGSRTFSSGIGVSSSSTLTAANSGNVAVAPVFGISGSGYSYTHNCGSSIAAGGSCTVTVSFIPSSTGAVAGTITLTGGYNGTSASLSGTGTAGTLSLSAANLSYPSTNQGQTSGTSYSVTATNTGSGAVTLSGTPVLAGTNTSSFSISSNTCTNGTTLAPSSGNCSFIVNFTPQATGSLSANITMQSSNASNSPTVYMTGTGTVVVASSCQTIKTSDPSSVSGVYTVDPDGAGGSAAFNAYCDMSETGIGWTLVGVGFPSNTLNTAQWNATTGYNTSGLTSPGITAAARYSDAVINQLKSSAYKMISGSSPRYWSSSCVFSSTSLANTATACRQAYQYSNLTGAVGGASGPMYSYGLSGDGYWTPIYRAGAYTGWVGDYPTNNGGYVLYLDSDYSRSILVGTGKFTLWVK